MIRNGVSILLVLSLLFLATVGSFGQESRADKRDLLDERRDVLRYGIDSEVITLLETLKNEEYDELNKELVVIYAESRNPALKSAAAEVLALFEYAAALEPAREILESFPDSESLLTATIELIVLFKDRESLPLLRTYAEDQKSAVALKAVEALGKLGGPEEIDYLQELYADDERSESVRAEALTALGRLESGASIPFLQEILQDQGAPRSFRWRACQALGEIGSPEALPAIEKAMNDGDTILRTYAVRALRAFDSALVYDYFIEALRDSFWRVRLAAVETLGERKERDSFDILAYKATRDPEEKIRIAAVHALAKIGGTRSFDLLAEISTGERNSQALRISALHALIKENVGASFDAVDAILESEARNHDSRIFVETVKALSGAEHPRLAGYFERLLESTNVSVVLMALQGIEENGFSALREKVRVLSESRTAASIKKRAGSVLESL